MSELEHCRLAHEGTMTQFIDKINADPYEDLSRKKDMSGRSALHWACVGNKIRLVEYLLKVHNVPLDEADDSGWTPLIISSSVGSVGLVNFLLDNGCNPNNETNNNQRALHYAASKNHQTIAEALLRHGADVNAADKYGSTALHRAVSKCNMDMIEILLKQPKIRVDPMDSEGNTPLHIAAEETSINVAKLLLKHGANPNILNKEKKTPIDLSEGGLLNIIDK